MSDQFTMRTSMEYAKALRNVLSPRSKFRWLVHNLEQGIQTPVAGNGKTVEFSLPKGLWVDHLREARKFLASNRHPQLLEEGLPKSELLQEMDLWISGVHVHVSHNSGTIYRSWRFIQMMEPVQGLMRVCSAHESMEVFHAVWETYEDHAPWDSVGLDLFWRVPSIRKYESVREDLAGWPTCTMCVRIASCSVPVPDLRGHLISEARCEFHPNASLPVLPKDSTISEQHTITVFVFDKPVHAISLYNQTEFENQRDRCYGDLRQESLNLIKGFEAAWCTAAPTWSNKLPGHISEDGVTHTQIWRGATPPFQPPKGSGHACDQCSKELKAITWAMERDRYVPLCSKKCAKAWVTVDDNRRLV